MKRTAAVLALALAFAGGAPGLFLPGCAGSGPDPAYAYRPGSLKDWTPVWGVAGVKGDAAEFNKDGFLMLPGGQDWRDYVVEAELEAGGRTAGLAVRVADQGRPCGGRYPRLKALDFCQVEFWPREMIIRGPDRSEPARDDKYHVANPAVVHARVGFNRPARLALKIQAEGENLRVWANGQKLFSGRIKALPARGGLALVGILGRVRVLSLKAGQ